MLKVEFAEMDGPTPQFPVRSRVIINDIKDSESIFYHHNDEDMGSGHLKNFEAIKELLKYSFAEVAKFMSTVFFTTDKDEWNFQKSVQVVFSRYLQDFSPSTNIELEINLDEWNKPYSLIQFADQFAKIIEADDEKVYMYNQRNQYISKGFGIKIKIQDSSDIIQKHIDKAYAKIHQIIIKTITTLLEDIGQDIIVTYF